MDYNLLAEKIKQLGFSTDISIPLSDKDNLTIYYKNVSVTSPFYKESLPKTTNMLEKKLINIGIEMRKLSVQEEK